MQDHSPCARLLALQLIQSDQCRKLRPRSHVRGVSNQGGSSWNAACAQLVPTAAELGQGGQCAPPGRVRTQAQPAGNTGHCIKELQTQHFVVFVILRYVPAKLPRLASNLRSSSLSLLSCWNDSCMLLYAAVLAWTRKASTKIRLLYERDFPWRQWVLSKAHLLSVSMGLE